MTTQNGGQPQLDLRPFQIFAPVPPMLADAIGYSGTVFGAVLDARFVGFYWESSGDEVAVDDGSFSGTGEYTGFQAFVEHPKVAVHLQRCDFGSSETRPRHYLLLDRTEQRLYALPVALALPFLQDQWQVQVPSADATLPVESVGDLLSALNLDTWQKVNPPDDFNERVTAAMWHQDQRIRDLLAWLNEQQKSLTAERMAEYDPHAPAMVHHHVFDSGAFARMGELVHIQEVRAEGNGQITITFHRNNGVDGPDPSSLFSLHGSWTDMGESLEPLVELDALDDLISSGASLDQVIGRYAAWNGKAFPIVAMLESLAIRVTLLCGRCGRNPTTVFARSGLHKGAFCYIYDAAGTFLADLRDQEYECPRCQQSRVGKGAQEVEDSPSAPGWREARDLGNISNEKGAQRVTPNPVIPAIPTVGMRLKNIAPVETWPNYEIEPGALATLVEWSADQFAVQFDEAHHGWSDSHVFQAGDLLSEADEPIPLAQVFSEHFEVVAFHPTLQIGEPIEFACEVEGGWMLTRRGAVIDLNKVDGRPHCMYYDTDLNKKGGFYLDLVSISWRFVE